MCRSIGCAAGLAPRNLLFPAWSPGTAQYSTSAARTWQIARPTCSNSSSPFLAPIIAGKTTWSGLWHAPVSAPRFSPAYVRRNPNFKSAG